MSVIHHIVDFQPAAVGTAETKAVLSVPKGATILSAHAEKLVLAAATTTSTISVGDGGSVARFVAATDTETGSAGDVVQPTTANLPYVYPADDTIDVDYIIGATPGATNPKWRIHIIYMLSK